MDRSTERGTDATPESAAVTGGVPAAAEAPPQTRGRASSIAAPTWIYILLGALLLIASVAFDQETGPAVGTALAGAALIAVGAMSLTGLGGPVTIALLGFLAGVLMTISAFSAIADFGFPQLFLLVAGAATFIASFALLAAARRPGKSSEEPQPGVEQV